MVDLETLRLKYFCNGFDVPYALKNGEIINIKPVLVKDYPYYEYATPILEIRKNETSDIEIIQMSYLDFLLKKLLPNDKDSQNRLVTICSLCFGYDYISIGVDSKKKSLLYLCNENGEIQKIISSKDFDDIIKIILNQNDSNYDNQYVSPEVRELMSVYYKNKYGDVTTPTLEQKKAYVCSKLGKAFKDLNDVTYREFDMIYTAALNSEIYIGQKIIQGSYKYDVKQDVRHPLFEPKKDPYAELFTSTSTLANKGISGVENLNAINAENIKED